MPVRVAGLTLVVVALAGALLVAGSGRALSQETDGGVTVTVAPLSGDELTVEIVALQIDARLGHQRVYERHICPAELHSVVDDDVIAGLIERPGACFRHRSDRQTGTDKKLDGTTLAPDTNLSSGLQQTGCLHAHELPGTAIQIQAAKVEQDVHSPSQWLWGARPNANRSITFITSST